VAAQFAEFGVSTTGMHAIGVLEIAGAAGLLIPRLVGAVAAGLVAR
jgi:putative oxidoreductase